MRCAVVSTTLGILSLVTGTSAGWLSDCILLGKESILFVRETVSKENWPVALIYYSRNSSYDVPLRDGEVIMALPGFDPNKKTVFYYLGFHQNAEMESVQFMVSSFLARGDCNVIVVDWSGFCTKDYFTALFGCFFKVPHVADVIKKMVSRGVPLQNFHLIGHSLGANCAAYTGRKFKREKIPIITGLDPAGPIVGLLCATSLKRGDAQFVQIIHSDRGFYATARACGDLDVFLNRNGFRYQPGCPCTFIPFQFTKEEGCSHIMAWKTYAESVINPASLQCSLCGSYAKFKMGFCKKNPRVYMGYGVDTKHSGHCYLQTNSRPPYGLGEAGALPVQPLVSW